MIDEESKKWLMRLAAKVDKLIEHECQEDRAYYNFKLTVDLLGSNFDKLDELVLINEGNTFCVFCHVPTHFYDNKRDMHLCAKCFAELEKSGACR